MNYLIQELNYFPVTLGSLTLYLSGCQLSGSSTLKEAGTPDGSAVLAGYWKQGCRLKLKGKLSPQFTTEQIILHLTQNMLVQQNFVLGKLSFPDSMLCGYTLSEQQDTPELSLLFYCPASPILVQEASSA